MATVAQDGPGCFCPIHVVNFTLISILATEYIQKRRGQALPFSFEYNLLPSLILNFNHYMDRALMCTILKLESKGLVYQTLSLIEARVHSITTWTR